MDIKELMTAEAHEEGAECNIKHPNTGKPTDIFITVMGPDSKEFRAQQSKLNRMYVNASRDGVDVDPDYVAVLTRKMIASITTGWRGVTDGDIDVPFSKDKCEELYAGSPFVFDQVDRFIVNYANFTKG